MKKESYELELKDVKVAPGPCPLCKSNTEWIQTGQLACKGCRTLFMVSVISDKEFMEWFCED